MFRFYSLLSPKGTPDRAALMAAELLEHKWQWNEEREYWTLHVFGLLSLTDLLFCANNEYLFIHENTKISKTPLPSRKSTDPDFHLHVWVNRSVKVGAQAIQFPPCQSSPAHWFSAHGEAIDVVHQDCANFTPTADGRRALPIFYVSGDQDKLFIKIAPRFLSALAVHGPVSATLTLRSTQTSTIAEIIVSSSGREFSGEIDLPAWFSEKEMQTAIFLDDSSSAIALN